MNRLLQNSENQLQWFNKTYKRDWLPAQQKAMALADTVSQQQLGLAGRASDMGAAAWEKGLNLWGPVRLRQTFVEGLSIEAARQDVRTRWSARKAHAPAFLALRKKQRFRLIPRTREPPNPAWSGLFYVRALFGNHLHLEVS